MLFNIGYSEESRVRVCVTGVDSGAQSLPGLKQILIKLHQEGRIHQVLDLQYCQELDEMGFSVLLIANRLCRNSGGSFILVGVNESMRNCIKKYQLERVLVIGDS